MKIISLQSNNIKRLTAVNITPEGNVIQITGKNGEGKSSVLDSIEMVLCGKDTIPAKPIHDGESKASIVADLGDMIVTRTFTKNGSYLKVETSDGAEYKSPQKMLDALVGRLSFDPMDFIRKKEKDQFKMLADYAGIDLTTIDAEYKEKYAERTLANKVVIAKKKEIDLIDIDLSVKLPEGETDPAAIIEKIKTGMENNGDIQREIDKVNRGEIRLKELQQELDSKKSELKEAEILLIEAAGTMDNMRKDLKLREKDIVAIDPLNEELSQLSESNNAIRKMANYKLMEKSLEEDKKQADQLTSLLKSISTKRVNAISKAKMPIDGLGFGDSVVNYNDIPLSQASSAEQIRVTVSIAMAMNPKLRIIRIKDGSLLDSDSMKIIDDMATKHDYQFWVERVDESGEVGIMIEDGQVKSVDGVEYVSVDEGKDEGTVTAKVTTEKGEITDIEEIPVETKELIAEVKKDTESMGDACEADEIGKSNPVKKIKPQEF